MTPGAVMRVWPPLSRSSWAVLALVTAVLWPAWERATVLPANSYDQPFYLGIAADLVQLGRFTDGFAFGTPGPSGERPSGMRFGPVYPALVAGAAMLDPAFRSMATCVVETAGLDAGCPNQARLVRGTQFGLLACVYLMVWWIARGITGSLRGGWVALGLALLTGPYLLRSVNVVMTETFALFLSTALAWACVRAVGSPQPWRWAAGAGVLLGALALTRPAFLYLFDAALLVGVAAVAFAAGRRCRVAAPVLAFALAFAVTTGPWLVRNVAVLDRAALSFGYASHTLVQRISYDAMTPREYLLSFVCGLPDGTGLGKAVAGPQACDRFALDEKRPDTFYAIGLGPLLAETLAASGGYEHHLGYLLEHHILRHPLKHALVTLPMALRGAWVQNYWGLLLGPVCVAMTVGAWRRRDLRFLVLALPAWFMLLLNAAVAVNQVRYNLMLMPAYAVAGALWLERWRAASSRRTRPLSPPFQRGVGGGCHMPKLRRARTARPALAEPTHPQPLPSKKGRGE